MSKFLIVSITREITIYTREIMSVRMVSNKDLCDYLTAIVPQGVLSIDLATSHDCNLENGWLDDALCLPNLLRFTDLLSLKIQYVGDVTTTNDTGFLTLPSSVCMLGLRHGNLRSNLRFGCVFNTTCKVINEIFDRSRIPFWIGDQILAFIGISEWPSPCAVIALSSHASISGDISWQTYTGITNTDLSLLVFADYPVDPASSPYIYYDDELVGYDSKISNSMVPILRGYDTRGNTLWQSADMDDDILDKYDQAEHEGLMYMKGIHRDPEWYDRQAERFAISQTVSGMLFLQLTEDYVQQRVSYFATTHPMLGRYFDPVDEVCDFLKLETIYPRPI
jgi:hypothetical protein